MNCQASTRRRRSYDRSVHQNWTVRIGGAVFADRTDQHPDEFAMSPTTHNQQVGPLRGLHENWGRMALHRPKGNLDVRILGVDVNLGLFEDLLHALRRVVTGREGHGPAIV